MQGTLKNKIKEIDASTIRDYTEMQRIRELPYQQRLKKEYVFRAVILRLEHSGLITNIEAKNFRVQFYNPNYQLKV